MGDRNRKTFRYGIKRGGFNQTDPNSIRRLSDLDAERQRSAVGRVDDSFHASTEDIDSYRRAMGRQ